MVIQEIVFIYTCEYLKSNSEAILRGAWMDSAFVQLTIDTYYPEVLNQRLVDFFYPPEIQKTLDGTLTFRL